MRINGLYILAIGLLIGCKEPKTYSNEDFQRMNGYWEITKVIFPDGTEKPYNANTTIDFIAITGENGFKKKVYPKLDGTYTTSDDALNFRILNKVQSGYYLSYDSTYEGWQEKINYIGTDFFSLKFDDGNIYCYRRFQPINIAQ